jgi:antitoxin MazE
MDIAISNWGNSLGIRIPKSIATQFQIKAGDKLEIRNQNGSIVLDKKRERKKLSELLDGYDKKYNLKEVDFGEAEGDEVW